MCPAFISFCTACKNRLWQLRQTLPQNLQSIGRDGWAELVLVNYNSQDRLHNWIRRCFTREIDAGLLRYVHQRTEPFFHCSKAKNLGHFAAAGEFVVNLDADNFIGETISRMREIWQTDPDTVIHGFCGDVKDGTYGRIGIAKRHFLALGGYDEEMLPVGWQDCDLLWRSRATKLRIVPLKQEGIPAVRNTLKEKMLYTGSSYTHRQMVKINAARLSESLHLGRLLANPSRKPMSVRINFVLETAI